MATGARSPEDLETSLEDAFVLRDASALAALFERDGRLATADPRSEAMGRDDIASLAVSLWTGGRTYVSHLEQVVQARQTALVFTRGSTSVMRRRADGTWRYAICLLGANGMEPQEIGEERLR